jgi:hypothetical protein
VILRANFDDGTGLRRDAVQLVAFEKVRHLRPCFRRKDFFERPADWKRDGTAPIGVLCQLKRALLDLVRLFDCLAGCFCDSHCGFSPLKRKRATEAARHVGKISPYRQ